MTINASVTASSTVGSVTYNWTINQSQGATISGVSVTTGSNAVVVTHPSTLTWLGANATSGTYRFTLQCLITDTGVSGCNQTKTTYLWFNDTPPTCTMTVTNIVLTTV